MEAVLGSGTAVGVNIEVMGRFPVIEVLGQHAVFDENFFSGVHAFIVHGIGAITTHHGGVVDHGDQFIANFLTEFSIQARIARSHQISLTRVAQGFVNVDPGEVLIRNEREFTGRRTFSVQQSERGSLGCFAQFNKVAAMNHFEATLASVSGSVGDHFTGPPGSDHPVDEGALERPHAVHALGGHEFGVDVFVAPPGAYGDDVVMTGGTLVEVVHEVHLLVEFSVANIEGRTPVGFVFDDRDLCQSLGPFTWRTALCNGFRQTCGGFDLVGKRGDVGR